MSKFLYKFFLLIVLSVRIIFIPSSISAESGITLKIISQQTLSGTAGDFVTVKGQIINNGAKPVTDVTTYLSLVDKENKLPVDLEDWSAEKGLFIGTIDAGQTLPLDWKIHFVKAGNYSLTVIADVAGIEVPYVSSLTYFEVDSKRNLNPGKVLPVAFGMPIVLVFLFLLLNYQRQKARY